MIDDMAVYIANLGKYNEGYLVGAWFTFPIDEEDVKEKIGLNEQYEEYAIHDTDNFPIAIGEYVSIEELNEMYEMIEELPDYIVECLDEFISHYGTLEEVVERSSFGRNIEALFGEYDFRLCIRCDGIVVVTPGKERGTQNPPPEDHQQPYESKIFHSIKGFSAGPTAVFIFGRNEAGLKKAILSGSFLCVKRNVFLSI